MGTKIQALGNKIVISPINEKENSESNIILPGDEDPKLGTVVSVGLALEPITKNGISPETYLMNKVVAFNPFDGDEWELEGETFIVMDFDKLFFILENEE